MLNLTLASLVLLKSSRSPLLSNSMMHAKIQNSIFRFQVSHIIYKLPSFNVMKSKFKNSLSTLIEQQSLGICDTSTSISDCEFIGNPIAAPIINLNEGYVNNTLFANTDASATSPVTSMVNFNMAGQENRFGSLNAVCFANCNGYSQAISTSVGSQATQRMLLNYVNYYMINQDMKSIVGDKITSIAEYSNINISSSVAKGGIFVADQFSGEFSYRYMDIRNNTITNYYAATQNNDGFGVLFEHAQFYNMLIDPSAGSLFIISFYVELTLSDCYFDEDSFTINTKINSLDFPQKSTVKYTIINCRFEIIESGSRIDYQFNLFTAFSHIDNLFEQKRDPIVLINNTEWMVVKQVACVISRTPPPTEQFSPSNNFTPNPTPLPPAATPSVNKLYASLGAIACPLIAFGIAAIVLLIFRSCLLYNHDNYLLIEI